MSKHGNNYVQCTHGFKNLRLYCDVYKQRFLNPWTIRGIARWEGETRLGLAKTITMLTDVQAANGREAHGFMGQFSGLNSNLDLPSEISQRKRPSTESTKGR